MFRAVPIKWQLAARVLPMVLLVVATKLVVHYGGFETLSLSPLFGAVISANVFLIGFLIAGVLADYKESERLPGELACALEALADEASIIVMNNKGPAAKALLAHIIDIVDTAHAWFHKNERTGMLMQKLAALNPHFLAVEPLTQANFIARMKQEQSSIRRVATRIHTIRDTEFNPSAYAIAEIISSILTVGLIFTRIEPYYESIFFLAFVSFVQIYMVMLIKDLDNPFEYYSNNTPTGNVSLKPLQDLRNRLTTLPIVQNVALTSASTPSVSVQTSMSTPPQKQPMRRKKR